MDFVNKINDAEKKTTEETFLVFLDGKSLYTNIPKHKGIKAAKEPLNTAKVITKFLFLMFTLNNLIFNVIHYLQKLGCVMGTICTPNYANIFMRKSERNFIYPFKHFQIFIVDFFDDIFLLGNGSETQLLDFITRLNSRHPEIKLEYKYSKSSIEFLYTKI